MTSLEWQRILARERKSDGCEYSTTCLECPFEFCRFERSGRVRKSTSESRATIRGRRARELYGQGNSISQIARELGDQIRRAKCQ